MKETFNVAIYLTQNQFKKISETVAKKNYRDIFNSFTKKKWIVFYESKIYEKVITFILLLNSNFRNLSNNHIIF